VYMLFGAVATKLTLPYFLLTWQPAWMKFLPKPKTWIIRFKQMLGFVMLSIIIWLLDSLPTTNAIVLAYSFLLVLGFGCWLMGSYHDSRWAFPAALLLAFGGWYTFVHDKVSATPVAMVKAGGDSLA